MPRIQQLNASVINKIAAGEVIERPANVVKELIENSVDALSTRIEVDIVEGGSELIRVSDDGEGIHPDDILLAISSHATSKIKTAEDLFFVQTMGFRGEALASICEVANVQIRSRQHDALAGIEMEINCGQRMDPHPCGSPPGTTIEVRNLFASTPVRRKFLKTKATEFGHICDQFTRVALANPRLRLVLRHNNKVVYDLPPTDRLIDRLKVFFGDALCDSLIFVESEVGDIRMSGYVGHPSLSKSSRKSQHLFLNGRWFIDRAIQHALTEAYRGLLMVGRQPIAFLFIDLPPSAFDINVHPTKIEVRFIDSQQLYRQMLSMVRTRFLTMDLDSEMQLNRGRRDEDDSASESPSGPREIQAELSDWASRQSTGRAADGSSPDNAGDGFSDRPGNTSGGSGRPAAPRGIERPPLTTWTVGQSQLARMIAAEAAPRTEVDASHVEIPETVEAAEALFAGRELEREQFVSELPNDGADASDTDCDTQSAGSNDSDMDTESTTAVEKQCVGDSSAGSTGSSVRPGPTTGQRSGVRAMQVMDCYLVVEDEQGLMIIDQHALHERIMYEYLRPRVLNNSVESQRMLIPDTVDVTAREAALLIDHQDVLKQLGFGVEEFGSGTILINAYPVMLHRANLAELLSHICGLLESYDRKPTRRDILDELLHMMSCKAAIKSGQRLKPEEIDSLLEQRHLCDDAHHCPHGRPTALVLSQKELDRQFGRLG